MCLQDFFFFVAFCLLTAPAVPAQPAQGNVAVGYVVTRAGGGFRGAIHTQDIDASCAPAKIVCTADGRPSAAGSGGAAYDARHQSVWVAYGGTIEEHHPGTCRSMLRFQASLLNSRAQVTGLAISDRHRRLYHLETTVGHLGIRAYDMRVVPPRPLHGWSSKLTGLGHTAGGLAYDETADRLYAATSFSAFYGWASDLQVIDPGASMNLVTTIPLPMPAGPNGPEPVSGAGYDARTRILYATDGARTVQGRVVDPNQGKVAWNNRACAKGLAGEYAGLAVIPGWTRRNLGSSCLGAPCSSCPGMAGSTVGGDPALGNESFGFLLAGAPLQASAFLLLGGGTATGGLQLPFLCGPLYPAFNPPPLVAGPHPTQGSAICGGSARAPLPVPVDPVLAGAPFCAQWILVCRGPGGTGLGISQAVEFTLAGS